MKKTNFKGLTALVTGASSGIGEAFVRELAKNGANLVITSRSEKRLVSLSRELETHDGQWVRVIGCDLSQPQGANHLFNIVEEAGAKIDILINNAGFGKWCGFLDQDIDTYKQMLNLNIKSLVELTYLFLPAMLERNSGGIINVSSTAAFQPMPFQAVYAASKAFVLSFTEALNGEYSDRSVHIMALCPGHTKSNFMTVANANPEGMSAATPQQVVTQGLRAYSSKRVYKVTGAWSNYFNSLAPRFFTRQKVVHVVWNMFKNRVQNSY